jgi:5-methyltetrahydropteroyltriglutamate--homocysteine methyltransferase
MASMSGGQDRRAFPEFYAEYDTATGLGKRLSYRVVVNEPISYSGDANWTPDGVCWEQA